jgi:hypothetical protein
MYLDLRHYRYWFFSVFDSLLFRPQTENDVSQYQEVQRVLREEIVNPLRQNLYVRADRVMKLRTLLENLSSVTGLTSEEKGNYESKAEISLDLFTVSTDGEMNLCFFIYFLCNVYGIHSRGSKALSFCPL